MRPFDLEKDLGKTQTVIVDLAFNVTEIREWTHAISLVVAREASILIPRPGMMVRSTYLTLPHPLVVMVNYHDKHQFKAMAPEDPATRSMILIRDNWTCPYGDEPHYGDTIDHVMPKSRGGKNTWGNLVAACHYHNELKADKTPEEMGWVRPSIPNRFVSHRKLAIQKAVIDYLDTMASADSTPEPTLKLVAS